MRLKGNFLDKDVQIIQQCNHIFIAEIAHCFHKVMKHCILRLGMILHVIKHTKPTRNR